MKLTRYIGWALLLGAFGAAAAEVLAPPRPGNISLFTSALDLWYTAWPGSLVFTQIRVERVAPFLWDPLAVNLLTLPGWVLLGLPGAVLLWRSQPRELADDQKQAELKKYEEIMTLCDDLAEEAREQGFASEGGDTSADFSGLYSPAPIERDAHEEDDEQFFINRAEELRTQTAAWESANTAPGSSEPSEKT